MSNVLCTNPNQLQIRNMGPLRMLGAPRGPGGLGPLGAIGAGSSEVLTMC